MPVYNSLMQNSGGVKRAAFTVADLFCGIGGFHLAAAENGGRVVYASDIDPECRRVYKANFGIELDGDITAVDAESVPDHDLLCAGFPCQPFSIMGERRGFDDIRGTLFFEIIRILDARRPAAFVLENVRQLWSHNRGQTLTRILESLDELGYWVDKRVLNALDFGLPQKRERVVIVGFSDFSAGGRFKWPSGGIPMKPLSRILERKVDESYFVSKRIRNKRRVSHKSEYETAIWHENKGGNVSSHPFSCALRAGSSYNYLLVNGERRLTGREMLRMQGFPNSFKIVCNYTQTRKQAGNAVPVPVISAIIKEIINAQTPQIERIADYAAKPVSPRRIPAFAD